MFIIIGENDVQQMDNTIFEDMDPTHSSNIEDGEINHFDEIIEDESEMLFQTNDDFIHENMSEEDCIRFWALSTNQPYRSIKMVLEILKSKYNANVPKSARTLLKTRRSNEGIMDIPGGKYWYNGIRNCISKYFR